MNTIRNGKPNKINIRTITKKRTKMSLIDEYNNISKQKEIDNQKYYNEKIPLLTRGWFKSFSIVYTILIFVIFAQLLFFFFNFKDIKNYTIFSGDEAMNILNSKYQKLVNFNHKDFFNLKKSDDNLNCIELNIKTGNEKIQIIL